MKQYLKVVKGMTKSPREEADALVDEFAKHLDNKLRQIPTKDRIAFLDSMNYNLGLRMALIYKKMGYGYKTANYPSWMFKRNSGQHEGKDLAVNCRPDTSIRTRFLDHFAKAKVYPRRTDDMGKWKYVSNPYFINSEFLEEAIKTMKEHGVRFDITGESNYFPGRTFQIRFEKLR
jgi:hypothetical protein